MFFVGGHPPGVLPGLFNPGQAWPGQARLGLAKPGPAWLTKDRLKNQNYTENYKVWRISFFIKNVARTFFSYILHIAVYYVTSSGHLLRQK